jgi:hypothetical protein
MNYLFRQTKLGQVPLAQNMSKFIKWLFLIEISVYFFLLYVF